MRGDRVTYAHITLTLGRLELEGGRGSVPPTGIVGPSVIEFGSIPTLSRRAPIECRELIGVGAGEGCRTGSDDRNVGLNKMEKNMSGLHSAFNYRLLTVYTDQN